MNTFHRKRNGNGAKRNGARCAHHAHVEPLPDSCWLDL